MRNRCCQGMTGVFPRRKRRSSRLPLAMYSYTRQPYSGQAPRRRTMFGCRIQLSTSTCTELETELIPLLSQLLFLQYLLVKLRSPLSSIRAKNLNGDWSVIKVTFVHRTVSSLSNLAIVREIVGGLLDLLYCVPSVPNIIPNSLHRLLPLFGFSVGLRLCMYSLLRL